MRASLRPGSLIQVETMPFLAYLVVSSLLDHQNRMVHYRQSQTAAHRNPSQSVPITSDNARSIFSSTFPLRSTTSGLLHTQPPASDVQRRQHSASGTKRKANGSPTSDLDSIDEDNANAIKRQRNTVAARRYRQKGRDRITELETTLKGVEEERDKLKLQLARKEAEVDALREMMKK
ncbi:hypothetical protein BDP55DRAFT_728049 [Colletotrichum godetiae]|uniref:BZIP domain-containing protein n=1 Tax=Colletotrichum godetiae TaxID=1209918 RepID=A0AAJ0ALP2_9PEZI|nr:uncharacterized protein BDP55DRAFT_728049 [Colletotrichum godetiae]KAK1676200.1 hypothetical protein BDP55DRAFT_728049 [Colletotrichum godetiae]